tara:strand:- start:258 stop:473 length:216 start_codon:yes stop_codon:yes gene_type:complete
MPTNKCFVCGSSNLIADRALSGRLVCTSCGTPYGVGKTGRNKFNNFNTFSNKKKYWIFIFIIIFTIILVII